MQLLDLQTILRKMGRGTVWHAVDGEGEPTRWAPADGALVLEHLGDTEGDMVFNANATVANLTLPEISGDAVHEATYTGEGPTIEIPLFLADPDYREIISPIGSQHAGHVRVQDVDERTVVILPEGLFRQSSQVYTALTYDGGTWQLGGEALDAAHQTLLGMSVWFWRCYWDRPTVSFLGGHGDDGKNIVPCMVRAMMHPDMPNGQRLYTTGDPIAAGVAIDGGS